MAIVSSSYTEGVIQADGSRWVTEAHVDSVGEVHLESYVADSSIDAAWIATRLAERAEWLGEKLAAAEFEEIVNG